MNIWNKLLKILSFFHNTVISEDEEVLRVRLSILTVTYRIIIFCACLYLLFFIYLGIGLISLYVIGCIGFLAIGYFLRKFKQGRLSTFILIIATNITIFIVASTLGREANIQFIFAASIMLTLLLMDAHMVVDIFVMTCLIVLSFITLELTDYSVLPHYAMAPEVLYPLAFACKVGGIVIFLVFMFISLFNKISVERELRRSKEVAEDALKVKSEFLSSMSHEIRTPMNGIIGFTDLMLQDEASPDKVEKLEMVRYSATNLMKIINEILDFSKIEAGKMLFEKEAFNFFELIEDFEKLQQHAFQKKGVQFVLELSSEIPTYLTGDKFRLHQVLLNIVSNAVKFTEKGYVKLSVIPVLQEGEVLTVKFMIQDTGIGIASNKLKMIFESFTQEKQSTTRQYGGTGLGLSITKKMIELQGGSIQAKSVQGVGSIFTLTIPFTVSTQQEIFNFPKVVNFTDTHYRDVKGFHILLVEDNVLNQKLAEHIFKKWKISYKLANNGLEAIEILQKEDFSAVLMDLHMPEMNGIDAAKVIRNPDSKVLNRQIPIIALTADVFEETKASTYEAGMNHFLSKPFSQESLLDVLLKAVGELPIEKTDIQKTNAEKPLNNQEYIDLHVLIELIGDDQESIAEILDEYISSARFDYLALKQSLAKAEMHRIQASAHKIKSSFNILGIKHLESLAKEIEFGVKRNLSIEQLQILFAEITAHFDATVAEAEMKRKSLKSDA